MKRKTAILNGKFLNNLGLNSQNNNVMSKQPTFPTLYEDLKTISISFLKKQGYLKPNLLRSGTITWSINENITGRISIKVNTITETPYLELIYKYNHESINYRVQLISMPSNLGKGVVWYFVCPFTKLLCRKLYLANTYFYHRTAFKGCMYEKQTQSKKDRCLDKKLVGYLRGVQLLELLNKKHFKKEYAGKQTKKYLKTIVQLQENDSLSFMKIKKELIDY